MSIQNQVRQLAEKSEMAERLSVFDAVQNENRSLKTQLETISTNCSQLRKKVFIIHFFKILGIGFIIFSFVCKSKYGILGGLCSSSQSVSYEVVFSIFLVSLIFEIGCYSFSFIFNFCIF